MAALNSVEGISSLLNQYPLFAFARAAGLGLFSTSICPFSIPASLGIVGYASSEEKAVQQKGARRKSLKIASFFFMGIVFSFFLLGVVASSIGQFLFQWENIFSLLAAGIAFMTGLALIFKFRLSGFNSVSSSSHAPSLYGAFGYGTVYSLTIVTTSTGPLLLLLAAAAVLQNHVYSVLLTVSYGIGRGLPFLILGTFASNVKTWSARLNKFKRPAEILIGVGLIVLALLMAKHGMASSKS